MPELQMLRYFTRTLNNIQHLILDFLVENPCIFFSLLTEELAEVNLCY